MSDLAAAMFAKCLQFAACSLHSFGSAGLLQACTRMIDSDLACRLRDRSVSANKYYPRQAGFLIPWQVALLEKSAAWRCCSRCVELRPFRAPGPIVGTRPDRQWRDVERSDRWLVRLSRTTPFICSISALREEFLVKKPKPSPQPYRGRGGNRRQKLSRCRGSHHQAPRSESGCHLLARASDQEKPGLAGSPLLVPA